MEEIEKALECLANSDYVGYFEEMDKVEIPTHQRATYTELKNTFVKGLQTVNFEQQLTILAKNLLPTENSENKPQPESVQEEMSETYVPHEYNIALPSKVVDEVFVGREKELQILETELLKKTHHKVFMVYGISGIGKTTLLEKFFRNNRKELTYVAWVTFYENLETSLLNAAELMAKCKVSEPFKTYKEKKWNIETLTEQFYKLKNKDKKLNLLIIDGMNRLDNHQIRRFSAALPSYWRVLISTTQTPDPELSNKLALGGLSLEEGVVLCKNYKSKLADDPQFEAWLESIEVHPLLISVVAKTWHNKPHLADQNLLKLSENLLDSLDYKIENPYFEGTRSPKAFFDQHFPWEDVEMTAKMLLFAFSLLPSVQISYSVLKNALIYENSITKIGGIGLRIVEFLQPFLNRLMKNIGEKSIMNEKELANILPELCEKAWLVRHENGSYSMHPFLAHIVFQRLADFSIPTLMIKAAFNMAQSIGVAIGATGNNFAYFQVFQKLDNLAEKYANSETKLKTKRELAVAYNHLGDYYASLVLRQEIETLNPKLKIFPDFFLLTDIASTYIALKQYTEAQNYLDKAETILPKPSSSTAEHLGYFYRAKANLLFTQKNSDWEKDYKTAIALYARYLPHLFYYPLYIAEYAWRLEADKKRTQAEAQYQAAIKVFEKLGMHTHPRYKACQEALQRIAEKTPKNTGKKRK